MNPSVNIEKVRQSSIVLGNAAELVASIVTEIAGNDISSSINGSTITRSAIGSLAMQRINKKLEQRIKQS